MENDKWTNVLIDWVNCLKLGKSIDTIEELKSCEFFSNLQKVITKSRDVQSDFLTFVFHLFSMHYPNYCFENNTEIHLSDLAENDLKAIASLLMHYTCMYDRKDVLTSPMCHSLAQTTQLIVRSFLQKMTKNVTNRTLNDIIRSCLEDVSDHQTNHHWLTVQISSAKNSPLQDLLKTPISKFGRLQEKDSLIAKLRSELETERYDKADLQDELKRVSERNKKFEQQLVQKSTEILRLKAEIEILENNTPPRSQDMDSRDLQRRLRSEIESLEQYVKQVENEQEELRKENGLAKEYIRKVKEQSAMWEEKFFEIERNFESLNEYSKRQEEELKQLKEHCSELSALLEEYKLKPENDSSLFDTFSSVGDGKFLNETPPGEDLACSVVEVQLRDAEKQNEELRLRIAKSDEVAEKLRTRVAEYEEKLGKIEDLNKDLELLLKNREIEQQNLEKQVSETEKFFLDIKLENEELENKLRNLTVKLKESVENCELLKTEKEVLLSQMEYFKGQQKQCEEQLSANSNLLQMEKERSLFFENEFANMKRLSEKLQFDLADALLETQNINTQLEETKNHAEKLLRKQQENENTRITLERLLFESQSFSVSLKDQLDDLQLKKLKADDEVASNRMELDKLEIENSDLTLQLKNSNEKINELQSANENLYFKINTLQKQLDEALNILNEEREKRGNIENQLCQVQTGSEKLSAELDSMATENKRAIDKLEEVEEEKYVLKTELQRTTNSLAEFKKKTEELQLMNDEIQLQLMTSQACSKNLETKLEQSIDENCNVRIALEDAEAKLREFEKKSRESEGKIESLQKESIGIRDTLEKKNSKIDQLLAVVTELEKKLEDVEVRTGITNVNLEKLKLENGVLNENMEQSSATVSKLKKENNELKSTICTIETGVQVLKTQNENLKQLLEVTTSEKENIQFLLERINLELSTKENSIATIHSERNTLVAKNNELEDIKSDLCLKLRLLEDHSKEQEMALTKLQCEYESAVLSLNDLEHQYGEKSMEIQNMKTHNNELLSRNVDLERRLSLEKENFEKVNRHLKEISVSIEEAQITKQKTNEDLMNTKNENQALIAKVINYEYKCINLEEKLCEVVNNLLVSSKELEDLKKMNIGSEKEIERLTIECEGAIMEKQRGMILLEESDSNRKILEDEVSILKVKLKELEDKARDLEKQNKVLASLTEEMEIQNKTNAHSAETILKEKEDVENALKSEIEILNTKLEELEKKSKNLREKCDDLISQNNEWQKEASKIGHVRDDVVAKLHDSLRLNEILDRENEDIKNKFSILERDHKELKNDKQILDKQLGEVSELSETLKMESEELRVQYQRSMADLEENRDVLKKTNEEKENLYCNLEAAKTMNQNLHIEISKIQERLEKENETFGQRTLQDEIKRLECESEIKTLKSQLDEAEKRIRELEENLMSKEQEMASLTDKIDQEKMDLVNRIETEDILSSESKNKINFLQDTVQDYEITISGLKSVVDSNLKNLEMVKEELSKIKRDEIDLANCVSGMLGIYDESGVENDLKTLITENISNLLMSVQEEKQKRITLESEIEKLKLETNVGRFFQEMMGKIQALVLDENEIASIETLQSNTGKIYKRIGDTFQLVKELETMKKTNETLEVEKAEIARCKEQLENQLSEEQEKAENLRRELETRLKPTKQEKENILALSTKSNKSREDELRKENMILKRKIVLAENAKNNIEKVLKKLREEKSKIKESPHSPNNDGLYKKLLQEYIEAKEENARIVRAKDAEIEELTRQVQNDHREEDNGTLIKDLQNIREAYGNVMNLNSKLETDIVNLKKKIEECNSEFTDVAHIKEAYEKLLEENNKILTEIDTLKYKRFRDKDEFVRLLKEEREKNANKEMKKIQEIRSEYESKLEKMKEKMLKLYREEVNKKLKSVKDGQSETAVLIRTVGNLRSELFEADQKIQILEMEREMLKSNRKIEDLKNFQMPVSSVTTSISKKEERRASTLPRPSITEEITFSRRTSINGVPNAHLQMEDEEDLFNDKYLTDLKEGRCMLQSDRDSTSRFSELAWRNSMVPPHLKSSYPAELQFISPSRFKDDDIKTGNIEFEDSMCKLLPGEKPRKKDFGTTSYKKPGPPTPSKNGGRLSLQGNEVHPIREHSEPKTPKKSTPSRIRALFTGRTSNAREESQSSVTTPSIGRRLNIFRRPR